MDSVATPDVRAEIEKLADNAMRSAHHNRVGISDTYALAAVAKAILYFADIYEKHHSSVNLTYGKPKAYRNPSDG